MEVKFDPLVPETLSREEALELLRMADLKNPEWDPADFVSVYKGWYKTWDEELHDGCIVVHSRYLSNSGDESEMEPNHLINDFYFMEVDKTLVSRNIDGSVYKVGYHKLMPITSKHFYTEGDESSIGHNLVSKIIDGARDDWDYYKKPLTEVQAKIAKSKPYCTPNYNLISVLPSDIDYWSEPLTEEERKLILDMERDVYGSTINIL